MTLEELKIEILKIVHKPGISPSENVEYAKRYMEYIQAGMPPNIPEIKKGGGKNK